MLSHLQNKGWTPNFHYGDLGRGHELVGKGGFAGQKVRPTADRKSHSEAGNNRRPVITHQSDLPPSPPPYCTQHIVPTDAQVPEWLWTKASYRMYVYISDTLCYAIRELQSLCHDPPFCCTISTFEAQLCTMSTFEAQQDIMRALAW